MSVKYKPSKLENSSAVKHLVLFRYPLHYAYLKNNILTFIITIIIIREICLLSNDLTEINNNFI